MSSFGSYVAQTIRNILNFRFAPLSQIRRYRMYQILSTLRPCLMRTLLTLGLMSLLLYATHTILGAHPSLDSWLNKTLGSEGGGLLVFAGCGLLAWIIARWLTKND